MIELFWVECVFFEPPGGNIWPPTSNLLGRNHQARTMKRIVKQAGSLLYRRLAVGRAQSFLSVKKFLPSPSNIQWIHHGKSSAMGCLRFPEVPAKRNAEAQRFAENKKQTGMCAELLKNSWPLSPRLCVNFSKGPATPIWQIRAASGIGRDAWPRLPCGSERATFRKCGGCACGPSRN